MGAIAVAPSATGIAIRLGAPSAGGETAADGGSPTEIVGGVDNATDVGDALTAPPRSTGWVDGASRAIRSPTGSRSKRRATAEPTTSTARTANTGRRTASAPTTRRPSPSGRDPGSRAGSPGGPSGGTRPLSSDPASVAVTESSVGGVARSSGPTRRRRERGWAMPNEATDPAARRRPPHELGRSGRPSPRTPRTGQIRPPLAAHPSNWADSLTLGVGESAQFGRNAVRVESPVREVSSVRSWRGRAGR